MKFSDIEPNGTRLLCSRYHKPEKSGSGIVFNPAWRRDNNRQMWRLLHWGEKGANFLREAGIEPEKGLLLLTAPNQGVQAEGIEADEEVFWLWAEQVIAVV